MSSYYAQKDAQNEVAQAWRQVKLQTEQHETFVDELKKVMRRQEEEKAVVEAELEDMNGRYRALKREGEVLKELVARGDRERDGVQLQLQASVATEKANTYEIAMLHASRNAVQDEYRRLEDHLVQLTPIPTLDTPKEDANLLRIKALQDQLFSYDLLREQHAQLVATHSDLQQQLALKNSYIGDLTSDLTATRHQLVTREQELTSEQQASKAAKESIKHLDGQLVDLRAQAASAQKKTATDEQTIKQLKLDLAVAREAIVGYEEGAANAKVDFSKVVEKQREHAEVMRESMADQCAMLKKRLQSNQQQWDEERKEHLASVASLHSEKLRLQQDMTAARQEREELLRKMKMESGSELVKMEQLHSEAAKCWEAEREELKSQMRFLNSSKQQAGEEASALSDEHKRLKRTVEELNERKLQADATMLQREEAFADAQAQFSKQKTLYEAQLLERVAEVDTMRATLQHVERVSQADKKKLLELQEDLERHMTGNETLRASGKSKEDEWDAEREALKRKLKELLCDKDHVGSETEGLLANLEEEQNTTRALRHTLQAEQQNWEGQRDRLQATITSMKNEQRMTEDDWVALREDNLNLQQGMGLKKRLYNTKCSIFLHNVTMARLLSRGYGTLRRFRDLRKKIRKAVDTLHVRNKAVQYSRWYMMLANYRKNKANACRLRQRKVHAMAVCRLNDAIVLKQCFALWSLFSLRKNVNEAKAVLAIRTRNLHLGDACKDMQRELTTQQREMESVAQMIRNVFKVEGALGAITKSACEAYEGLERELVGCLKDGRDTREEFKKDTATMKGIVQGLTDEVLFLTGTRTDIIKSLWDLNTVLYKAYEEATGTLPDQYTTDFVHRLICSISNANEWSSTIISKYLTPAEKQIISRNPESTGTPPPSRSMHKHISPIRGPRCSTPDVSVGFR
eukprot:TRINITY_DN9075_c1_g1_i1.p1 TRINITY_DN9075_c1_g1~~TRINITY_DN9075_c1_g1_i1.p1  ORF type:complete len:919 (+),score=270.31 TRINITY_DN9075_c1_g1_i1:73-2829(+)